MVYQLEPRLLPLSCEPIKTHTCSNNFKWGIEYRNFPYYRFQILIASLLILWCENCNETFLRVFKTVCARSLLEAYLSGDLSWWSWEEDEDFIIILSFTKLLRDFELQWTHCLSITSSSEVEKSSISWDHPRKIPTVVYLIIYSTFYSFLKITF